MPGSTHEFRSTLQVRAARADEARRLTEIAVTAKQFWGYSAEAMRAWLPILTVSSTDIQSNLTYVAEAANRAQPIQGGAEVLGFYMLCVEDGAFELEHLWVAPQWMRKGIGKTLLLHAVEKVRRGNGKVLRIDADPNAEMFYRACGARRIDAAPAPIPEDSTRVRPILELKIV